MAGTLNKVMLIGHLGDEVKMHYFDGGNSLGRFSIATNETYTNKSTGERVTTTEWHNLVVRNKLAEICEKYLSKGDKVYAEGRLKTRQWEDDNGNKRYSTEIQVTELKFLTTKKEATSTVNSANQEKKETNTTTNTKKAASKPEEEDDLPF